MTLQEKRLGEDTDEATYERRQSMVCKKTDCDFYDDDLKDCGYTVCILTANCCKTCGNASGYTGADDFYCEARKHYIRAEVYDCKDHKQVETPAFWQKKLSCEYITNIESHGIPVPSMVLGERGIMNLEQKTITSMEVADMVGKDHKGLLRDIRRYVSQFNESKIALVDFFTESTYTDAKGENRPCYLVTKKGCDFIAHKLTGPKGTVFTAKYIDKFHEMEEVIQKPRTALEQIALIAQGTLELEQKVETVEQKVYSIENDMPLFGAESDEVSSHVKRRGVELLGGKKSDAYKDNTVRQKVFKDIYNQLRREFGLYDDDGKMKSYKALKRKDLADAHEFIDCYKLPGYLQDLVEITNTQVNMEDFEDAV